MTATANARQHRTPHKEPTASLGARLFGGVMWLCALGAVALFRVIDSTIDLHVFGYEHVAAQIRARRPFIVVVWHGKGLLPIFFFQGLPLVVYSSQPRDGTLRPISAYIRRLTLGALHHLGYQVVDAAQYPSESRGVIRFLQVLGHSHGGVIAADGPAGPMFHAKPGAAFVAKKTGVSLIPVGAAMQHVITFESWDRFEIPEPFTKGALVAGTPIVVPDDIDDAGLADLSRHLELVLNDLTAQAEVEAFATRARRAPASSSEVADPP